MKCIHECMCDDQQIKLWEVRQNIGLATARPAGLSATRMLIQSFIT